MPIEYLLELTKNWIVAHGIFLTLLVLIGFLIPRVGRRIIASAGQTVQDGTEAAKGRKAIVGAVVYIAEALAYTALVIAAMKNLGINLAAAAIPATVVSAAVGFGSQKIIGDLLGGFFIITEKQYGVGDWVKFYGSGATVEGDVVDMTLRATTIRTINGDEITVPNGEARMCVNSSARWARAVVNIPVPITAGSSMAEINARTLAAAEDAVLDPDLGEHLRGEITFQPATAVTPPSAMGLPWTTTIRIMVDVAPGKQWLIERALRAAILDEWWEDYGKRASETALLDDNVNASLKHLLDTQEFRAIPPAALSQIPQPPAQPQSSEALANAAENTEVPRDQVLREIEEREDEVEEKPRRVAGLLSLGGRVRPSTTLLLLALVAVGMLGSMTLSGGTNSDKSGWLAPKPVETQAPAPAPAPPTQPEIVTPVQPEVVTTQPVAPLTTQPTYTAPPAPITSTVEETETPEQVTSEPLATEVVTPTP
ncbi:putative MscS family protein YkuT [Corynebacterium kalinowskii]|uniref:MscS family protein YkuT n=1 Tax=Corynebacterium kalinowskii TaxID=2675216 RepID=A0A6B8VP60_9CORY|nr:mechanosensitive ion channel family protein [Corynebacterium kalinowskii]QGU03204.1 putative MscS family protein YkuT [Corynebacterium kalinowskii]